MMIMPIIQRKLEQLSRRFANNIQRKKFFVFFNHIPIHGQECCLVNLLKHLIILMNFLWWLRIFMPPYVNNQTTQFQAKNWLMLLPFPKKMSIISQILPMWYNISTKKNFDQIRFWSLWEQEMFIRFT